MPKQLVAIGGLLAIALTACSTQNRPSQSPSPTSSGPPPLPPTVHIACTPAPSLRPPSATPPLPRGIGASLPSPLSQAPALCQKGTVPVAQTAAVAEVKQGNSTYYVFSYTADAARLKLSAPKGNPLLGSDASSSPLPASTAPSQTPHPAFTANNMNLSVNLKVLQPAKAATFMPFSAIYGKQNKTSPLAPPPPLPPGTCQGTSWYGNCFYYASAAARGSFQGAGGSVTIARPTVNETHGTPHSLIELAVQTDSGNIVEVGWSVASAQFGDDSPHLFVYHWINRQPTCYNDCGWVQRSSTYFPGMSLSGYEGKDTTLGYEVDSSGNWWAWFNGEWLGYYPAAEWGGQYLSAQTVQWFGEVERQVGQGPPIEMGTGLLPVSDRTAKIFQLCTIATTGSPCVAAQPILAQEQYSNWYDIKTTAPADAQGGGPGGAQ